MKENSSDFYIRDHRIRPICFVCGGIWWDARWFMGYRRGYEEGCDLAKKFEDKLVEVGEPVVIGDVLRAISNANPTRHHHNLIRRILKQMEELGEAAEAFLNVTSAANGKDMTWADVRHQIRNI